MLVNIKKVDIFISFFLFSIGSIITFASEFFHLNKTHIGLAFAIPPLIYLALKKREKVNLAVSDSIRKRVFYLLSILFFIIISLSLWFWHSETYHRPIIFFVLIALIYVIIINQILFTDSKKYVSIILFELFIVAIILRASIYFEFPTVYGNDPFFHTKGIQLAISQGSLPSQLADYVNFPYTHLITSSISNITNFSIKNSYFAISIIEVLGSLFVFLIAKKLGGTQIGLLSVAIITLAPYNILWGFWIIPMTLGLVFLMNILYLYIKRYLLVEEGKKYPAKISFLLIFICLSSILVHTVASFITVIILALTLAGLIFSRFFIPSKKHKNPPLFTNLIILFVIVLLSYWMYSNKSSGLDFLSLFSHSLLSGLTKMDAGSVSAITLAPSFNYMSILLVDLPFILLMFFGIFGSLLITKHLLERIKFALIFSVIFLIGLVYAAGFAGIKAILPSRWFVFIELLLAFFTAYGIYHLISVQNTYRKKVVISSTIIFIFAFSAITSPLTNSDSSFYASELGGRKALIDSEVIEVDFINSHYNGTIVRNSKYSLLEGSDLDPSDPETYYKGLIVLRNFDLEKGFKLYGAEGAEGKIAKTITSNEQFYTYIRSSKCQKIFNNGEVNGYLTWENICEK